MNISENSPFPLTTLPYMIQSRFMECLPYFLQIELAQTNQQFLQIYETRCRKRNISDSVNIVIKRSGIFINDEKHTLSLFRNKKSIKRYIQGNHFPTKLISILNVENVAWVDIGILAKDLVEHGLHCRKLKKEVDKWMKQFLDYSDVVTFTKIEIGWKRSHTADELTNEKCLMALVELKGGCSALLNLSYYSNRL